ncbi:MAG TPA: glycosyltransferase family 2 protein [Kiritimatiellia bacterium]|nr:glycosyltransferase family 2 protein [Kiritimatiellia bacterium]HNR93334.1 glycosyltransferase family 2 protein [Kiritimatiellia bacterium]HNS79977.1 glycosyltransferase family 2 protein [Kiritimatiellia bacterium]HQQ03375.1 glycosyltransferase family 2 protein [Kiritimatiellia bacterium]
MNDSVTVLIPVYNEAPRIAGLLNGVLKTMTALGVPWKVIIINDGSTDWSSSLEHSLTANQNVAIRTMTPNRGKGAVLNDMFAEIETALTVVIDGDGEYSPRDIPVVLQPLLNNEADWVLGSRFGFGRERPPQYMLTYLANRIINLAFRLMSGLRFRDILSGLYAYRSALTRSVHLDNRRFSFTPELIWRVQRMHRPRWQEVPAGYYFRTYGEGKKIRWWETFTILCSICKYRFKKLDQIP